jgi:hypothetical protein
VVAADGTAPGIRLSCGWPHPREGIAALRRKN